MLIDPINALEALCIIAGLAYLLGVWVGRKPPTRAKCKTCDDETCDGRHTELR